MRRLLAERAFPVDELRYFASARSAGTTLPWGHRDHRRGRRNGRPERPRHRPVLGRRHVVARARPALRRRRRHGHRQLLRVPHGPRRPAGRLRGQPGGDRRRPQGHHRQPQLHDDGGDAGAQAAPRRGRPLRLSPRRTRPTSGAGLAGVDELDKQVRQVADQAAALTHDGDAVVFPAPRSSPARSRSTCSRTPARSSTTAPTRPTRSRSSARRAARSSASPTCSCRARASGCRCSPATRCRSTPSSPGRCRSPGPPSCSPRRPVSS